MTPEERKDLDETRRLLYMTLAAGRTAKYDLAGTLTNALAHHGLELDPDETLNEVVAAIEDGRADWVKARISELGDRLEEPRSGA